MEDLLLWNEVPAKPDPREPLQLLMLVWNVGVCDNVGRFDRTIGDDAAMEICNREALVDRFGKWPSFHDAEIYAARFDSGQTTDGVARLELEIHLFVWDGGSAFPNHTLDTLRFSEIAVFDFKWFGAQNVLMDLEIEETPDPENAEAPPVLVKMPSSAGLDGVFRCSQIEVVAAEKFRAGRTIRVSSDELDHESKQTAADPAVAKRAAAQTPHSRVSLLEFLWLS